MQQEIRVTARQQTCWRRLAWLLTKTRLVLREHERISDRCAHRDQRIPERSERRGAAACGETGPLGEAAGITWPVHMKVPTCELESCVEWIDVGTWQHPDRRLASPIPAERDSAGGGSIT